MFVMAVDDMRPLNSKNRMVDVKEERGPNNESSKSTIHSGHFMVSRVHDVNNEDDDEEEIQSPFIDDVKGFDFLSANREISKTYNFGNANNIATVSIDASLTKLFECMTLAYSGKITSPRWKQFRGLHVSQKQRIRLNNLIWREWHMQYIYQKAPMVCQFACPLSDDVHSKPEAVVLEGKYWKRRLDTVTAEYKKWRRYYKERIRQQQGVNFHDSSRLNENELLERVKDVTFITHSSGGYVSNTDLNLLKTDMSDMDFTNELFASLNQPFAFPNLSQPFAFPNPRELSQLGCGDLIQPGLVQLQPNLEEFMDIDTMQELLNSRLPNSFGAFVSDSSLNADVSQSNMNSNEISLADFLNNASIVPTTSSQNDSATIFGGSNSINNNFLTGTQNITFQVTSDNGQYHLEPSTIFLGPAQNFNVNQPSFTLVQTGVGQNIGGGSSQPKSFNTSADILTQMLQQRPMEAPRRQQTSSTTSLTSSHHQHSSPTFHQPSPSACSPLLVQSLTVGQKQPAQAQKQPPQAQKPSQSPRKSTKTNNQPGISEAGSASGVMTGLAKMAGYNTSRKKDGVFAVPVKKPTPPRKTRNIAPAPTTSPPTSTVSMQQQSYLAELLKNGTYPGALINVKKEPQLIQPQITTTTNLYQPMRHNSNLLQHISSSNMVSLAPGNQIQATLPLVAANTVPTIDVSSITSQALNDVNITFSGSLMNISTPVLKTSSELPQDQDTEVHSVNLLQDNPSPLAVKRSPSPALQMDTSSLMDPVSPYSSMPLSPTGMDDPESPGSESGFPKDNRRVAHLSAEQKRRCNLKTGFDMLQHLVPSLAQNPKVSKATMLQKTAEFCKKLKAERIQMQKEAAILKKEIDSLNIAISNVQSQLPETGVPVTRQRKDQMREMFDEYVRIRTTDNWKFWIFSVIMNSLYDSYCNTVSTASLQDLYRTSLTWLDQSCSLVTLRPNVLNALRKLSTTTSILTEPHKVKDQALQAVSKQAKRYSSNNMMNK